MFGKECFKWQIAKIGQRYLSIVKPEPMRTEILFNCYSCDAALDPIPSLTFLTFLTVQHIILVACYVFAIINTK